MAADPTFVQDRPASARAQSAADGAALLYERYYDRVFGYCMYQLGSREEAEDVAQTTFMWALRGLRRGVVPLAEASWLFTIAQNACRARHRSRGRKRAREVLSDPVVLADISPAHVAEADDLVGLEDALAQMPELQRRALLLREWRGLSYKEIAAELELSDSAVETLIFRARRSLAELLAGKPAPRRARRFAFFPGAIAAACRGFLGPGTLGKVPAGLAAALVATTVVGSQESPRSEPRNDQGRAVAVVAPEGKPLRKAKPTGSQTTPKKETEPAAQPSVSPSEPVESSAATVVAVADDPVGAVNDTSELAVKTVRDALAPVTEALPEVGVDLP